MVHNELPEGEWDEYHYGYTIIRLPFIASMRCLSRACDKPVVLLGWAYLEPFDDERHTWPPDFNFQVRGEERDENYVASYKPRFVLPSPPIFPIPKTCPPEISVELQSVFCLYWCDSAAAANRIRTAIERVCDHLKIPREETRTPKKPRYLTLHDRLQKLGEQRPALAKLLGQVKWLGNVGSHGGHLGHRDMLDALEVVEHVLDGLFVRRAERAARAADRIRKRRS